ncbi:hypothetical protein FGADI_175 [Fusarium gaditjirri]|uniref:Uncharacterized protein n=1 Tax=Fusarium gaditjirri TaxID=282569 RepID=A0A8H4TP64_9HYPO|nr:hypothetical protein FGADI_175 [Fusarium gaditjirri]
MTRSAKDWMGDLSGDLNITQLSIPGTHNSHAIKSNVEVENNSYVNFASHALFNPGIYGMYAEFYTAIATCQLDPMWKQLQNGVREVRGRAILVRRFESPDNEILGINFYNPSFYNSPQSDGPIGKWKQMPHPDTFSMTIEERWNTARSMLNEAKEADLNDKVMYFASTSDTWISKDWKPPKWWEPRYYAERVNPLLALFLSQEYEKPKKGRYGVVVTDFCDATLARCIFEQNFSR